MARLLAARRVFLKLCKGLVGAAHRFLADAVQQVAVGRFLFAVGAQHARRQARRAGVELLEISTAATVAMRGHVPDADDHAASLRSILSGPGGAAPTGKVTPGANYLAAITMISTSARGSASFAST